MALLVLLPRRASSPLVWPLLLALSAAQVVMVLWAPSCFWSSGPLCDFLKLGLSAGNLSRVMLLAVGMVAGVTVLTAMPMVRDELKRLRLGCLLLLSVLGMNGVVLVSDLFTLYVFLEVTSVSSFVLIALNRDSGGLEGAFKYIVLSAIATVLMLSGVSALLLLGGGTSFEAIGAALRAAGDMQLAHLAVGAFVCGLLIKGGLVPFHGWLPAAYSAAPAPVSVLLGGVVTKVSGLYALIKLLGAGAFGASALIPHNPLLSEALMVVGAASIIMGALAALGQSDMKRMLAYSSISQMGYIVLALGCGTNLAIVGAVFHLFNHAVFKSLLFVNAAAVESRAGTTDMNRLGALGGRMPVTNFANLVASLSTAGVPPLAGFWSKLIIIVALWQAGLHVYAAIAVALSVLTLGYLLVLQRRVFFAASDLKLENIKEAAAPIVIAAVILTLVTVGLGVAFPGMLNSFLLPIEKVL
jgi:multicomponent Na+:H+ antiporter subunit D